MLVSPSFIFSREGRVTDDGGAWYGQSPLPFLLVLPRTGVARRNGEGRPILQAFSTDIQSTSDAASLAAADREDNVSDHGG